MTLKDLFAQIFTADNWQADTTWALLLGTIAAVLFLALPYLFAVIGKWGLEHGIFPL